MFRGDTEVCERHHDKPQSSPETLSIPVMVSGVVSRRLTLGSNFGVVAQVVEQWTENPCVESSTLSDTTKDRVNGSNLVPARGDYRLPFKHSADICIGTVLWAGSKWRCSGNSLTRDPINAEVTQLARASAFQAESCGFESRFPLKCGMIHRFIAVPAPLGKELIAQRRVKSGVAAAPSLDPYPTCFHSSAWSERFRDMEEAVGSTPTGNTN